MTRQKTNYFSHDANARNSAKLLRVRQKHGMEGYGTYFAIIERLREETGYQAERDYNTIAFDLRVGAQLIKSIIEDFGLFAFAQDGKRFYSESLCERMKEMDEVTERMRELGKASGMARRKKSEQENERPLNERSNVRSTPTNKLTNQQTNETNQENQPTSNGVPKMSPEDGGRTRETSLPAAAPAPPTAAGRGGGAARVGNLIQQAAAQAANHAAGPAATQAGAAVPGPAAERNTRGLLDLLGRVGIHDQQDIREILRLSNQGQIGHPVWPLLCGLRDGKFGSGIAMPGKFVLARLRG